MKHAWTRGEGWGKGTAAVLGGFAVFLLFGMALGTALPLLGVPLGWTVGLGVALCVPVWALVVGWAVLAPSGRGAWLRVGGAALVFAAVTALTTL
ncbi:hypothetical protein RQM47_00830 [Rubrivirga sp. S365]|uniref:Uncharacterized protein n=1 Tax=Rubrivirga litoralis TaxID=3075598 RepID=A0ABU3BUE6_9BACT|nr:MULTISPECIES: hypothetical protein [unclassified Rubrivirga]MDT0632781.1 hypothetical protein [Rubrivirga sp. F394]MDT7855179.1 hypothetical protein [Rubrivirga sp. S365]